MGVHRILESQWAAHPGAAGDSPDCLHYCTDSAAWNTHVAHVLTTIVAKLDARATATSEIKSKTGSWQALDMPVHGQLCESVVIALDSFCKGGVATVAAMVVPPL